LEPSRDHGMAGASGPSARIDRQGDWRQTA
jgi:hypothetical protein